MSVSFLLSTQVAFLAKIRNLITSDFILLSAFY